MMRKSVKAAVLDRVFADMPESVRIALADNWTEKPARRRRISPEELHRLIAERLGDHKDGTQPA